MYKRILVPVDGSDAANRALSAALGLAVESGGIVRLLHVMDSGTFFGGFDPYGTYTADLLGVMREAGMKVLNKALETAKAAGVEATWSLPENLDSRLGETVADEARLWNADLIVTGSHGRRGVGRIMLGSGAEQIMRHAPVPVLLIRATPDSNVPAA